MGVYIISEVGPNHNGDINIAKKLVKELSKIGVDAVKFQLSNPEKTLSLDAFKANYQKENDNAEDIFEAVRKRQLSYDEHIEVALMCKDFGVDYLCTAFDIESLVFLDTVVNVPKFKIASGELFSIDMLEYISTQSKDVILSTGMASLSEISNSIQVLDKNNNIDLTLLHCVSNYPAPIDNVNIKMIKKLRSEFKKEVGFSDHTIGNISSICAVSMGATIIEKHVTLDKTLPGPDHRISSSLEEFAELVKGIREAELCIGSEKKVFTEGELDIAKVARKSIVAVDEIPKGDTITRDNVCYKRPGTGISPMEVESIVGKIAKKNLPKNRVIMHDDLK